MYDLPNASGITGLWAYTNTVTNNWFSILFLFSFWLIALIAFKMKVYKTSDCLAFSSFLTLIIGSLLWAAGLLAGSIMLIFLSTLVIGVIWSFIED